LKCHNTILFVCALLVGSPLAAAAQFPGSHLDGVNRARLDFLASTLQSLTPTISQWKRTMSSDDAHAAADFFLDDGLYSPLDGTVSQGRSAIEEALVLALPRMGGFSTTMVDFSASGNMAYHFGRFSYAWTTKGGFIETQAGTYVMILYQAGREWKIRAYVERSNAPDIPD
jgi:uncharacterized protein (TIGR02246 family)